MGDICDWGHQVEGWKIQLLEVKVICWKFRAWKAGLRTKAGGRESICYHTLFQNLASSDPETTKKRLRDTHQWHLRSCSHIQACHPLFLSLHIHYCCCDASAVAADWKSCVLWLSLEQFCQSWQRSFARANTITYAAGQLLFQLVLVHMCSLNIVRTHRKSLSTEKHMKTQSISDR